MFSPWCIYSISRLHDTWLHSHVVVIFDTQFPLPSVGLYSCPRMYILLQRKALWSEKKYSCDSGGTLNVKRHIGAKSFSEIAFSPPKGGPLGPLDCIFVPKGVVAKKTFSFLFLSFFESEWFRNESPESTSTSHLLLICFWVFYLLFFVFFFCLVTVMCCDTFHCWRPLM